MNPIYIYLGKTIQHWGTVGKTFFLFFQIFLCLKLVSNTNKTWKRFSYNIYCYENVITKMPSKTKKWEITKIKITFMKGKHILRDEAHESSKHQAEEVVAMFDRFYGTNVPVRWRLWIWVVWKSFCVRTIVSLHRFSFWINKATYMATRQYFCRATL